MPEHGSYDPEILRSAFERASRVMTRLEAIVVALEGAIDSGVLAPGTRLPTVRTLSTTLKVSPSTVMAAYQILSRRAAISGEVGRGTFVLDRTTAAEAKPLAPIETRIATSWRRRTAAVVLARLHAHYPGVLDCAHGQPDPALMPGAIIKRALGSLAAGLDIEDLQYSDATPISTLREALLPRLRRDGVPVSGNQMVVGNSAQQLMVLSIGLLTRLLPDAKPVVAVEDPGYQTAFDSFEQAGFRLVGMAMDEAGVLPEALEAALAAGAGAVLVTPRVHNPTGVSWTARRRGELAEILLRYPQALVIEDDHFADLATTRPGSLLEERLLRDRVIHIRTFAKSVAPDLRVAVAIAAPRLAVLLGEARALTDGWTSQLSQALLAATLADPGYDVAMEEARATYRARSEAAGAVLRDRLAGTGATVIASEGINLWITLPRGAMAGAIIEAAVAGGVLAVSGETFHVQPGRDNTIRMSIGAVTEAEAAAAAGLLADAIIHSRQANASRHIPV